MRAHGAVCTYRNSCCHAGSTNKAPDRPPGVTKHSDTSTNFSKGVPQRVFFGCSSVFVSVLLQDVAYPTTNLNCSRYLALVLGSRKLNHTPNEVKSESQWRCYAGFKSAKQVDCDSAPGISAKAMSGLQRLVKVSTSENGTCSERGRKLVITCGVLLLLPAGFDYPASST